MREHLARKEPWSTGGLRLHRAMDRPAKGSLRVWTHIPAPNVASLRPAMVANHVSAASNPSKNTAPRPCQALSSAASLSLVQLLAALDRHAIRLAIGPRADSRTTIPEDLVIGR